MASRTAAYLLSLCFLPLGCSAASANKPATQPALYISTADLYARIQAMPAAGKGSLAERFANVGSMSFPSYFTYLRGSAIDAEMHLDGAVLPNARALLTSHKDAFTAMGEEFPTVGAWWQQIGFKPDLTLSQADFTDQLKATLGQDKLSLVDAAATPQLSLNAKTASYPFLNGACLSPFIQRNKFKPSVGGWYVRPGRDGSKRSYLPATSLAQTVNPDLDQDGASSESSSGLGSSASSSSGLSSTGDPESLAACGD